MLTQMIRDFRNKLQAGPVFGPFAKTMDPGLVEVLGHAGFDFVILDLEHGPNSVLQVQNLVRAGQIAGVLPIVRVKEGMPSLIGEVLDVGAGGVQVPQVTTREDAEMAVRAARFAPLGMRGVCRFVRAADYSAMDRFAYFREANMALLVVQLEGREALANLDAILDVAGIDVIFIGPYDLSQSLGVPGEVDHPLVEERMLEIADRCRQKERALGTFTDTLAAAATWQARGVRYVSYSVDMGLFYLACRETVTGLRGVHSDEAHGQLVAVCANR